MITGRVRRSFRKGGNSRITSGRRLAIESLEPRLALTWAGVPPVSIAPPAAAVGVTLTSNDASGAASIATTEVDYYSFTASITGSYIISATTPSSSLDTVLGVFSATGQRLAYNDDITYPSNTDSRVTLNLTAGTRYYVGITNFASASRGAYNWTIDGPAVTTLPNDDGFENNDTFGTAYNLGTLGATQTVSSLKLVDAADWFRFTTSTTGTGSSSVAISFQNTQGNLQLALYNSAGVQIGSSLGTGNTESISLNGLIAGTYYVDIFGASAATNPNYTLTIAPPTVAPPPTGGGFQITLQMTGLTTNQQAIFQQAANKWSQVIIGDIPNAVYRGQAVDDLLINASAPPIDGVGGILGQAGPDAFRTGSLLPIHGVMEFDSADMANMESNGTLLSVVLHEMGHILGIGTLWSSFGLLQGAGTANPIFTGVNATAQYNQYFNTSAAGVPVENSGGPGTRDSHWRESVLTTELMTGYANNGPMPLSRITIGSLQDIGYSVNYAAADPYTPSLSALTAARQATSASAALRGLRGLVSSTTGVTSNRTSSSLVDTFYPVRPHRSQVLPGSYIQAIDSDDVAPIDAGQTASSGNSETSHVSTDASGNDTEHGHCAADHIWDSLASTMNFWAELAHA